MLECLDLHLLPGFNESDRGHALQLVAEMVADGGLENLVDEVFHRSYHRDYLGRLRIRHMDLHLQIDIEHKALFTLGAYLLQLGIQVVRLGNGIRPVECKNRRRDDLRFIAAGIDRVLARAQRLLPDAAMPGAHQRTEFELRARGVLRHQADICLDHRHLSLLDHKHRYQLHTHQERIECERAVQQRIMLEADPAAVIQERLEVLVVVVQRVLIAQQPFDDLSILHPGLFHLFDIDKTSEAAGDRSRGQRVPLKRGYDADHVDDPLPRASRLGRDPYQFELRWRQSKGLRRQLCSGSRLAAELRRDGQAIGLFFRDHQETHRVNRHERTGTEDRALHSFLPRMRKKIPEVREISELFFVNRRFGSDR